MTDINISTKDERWKNMIDSINKELYSRYNNNRSLDIEMLKCATKDEIYSTVSNWAEKAFYQAETMYNSRDNNYTYAKDEAGNLSHLEEDSQIISILEKQDIEKLQALGFDIEKLFVEDYEDYNTSSKSKDGTIQRKSKQAKEKEYHKQEETLNRKIDRIKEQRDEMYLASLGGDNHITINSLYENSFKGEYNRNNQYFKTEDINKVLEMNNIEKNENTTWAAKMLLDYGMEVDTDSVRKLGDIQAAIDSLEGFATKQKEIEDIEEKKIEERILVKGKDKPYTNGDIDSLKQELSNINSKDIKEVLDKGDIPSIKNLKEMMYKNTKKALGGKRATGNQSETETTYINTGEVKEVKDQIDIIRSKLTAEAAQKISQKMPLESMQLSEIVKELKVIEEDKINKALHNANLEVNEENKDIVQNVMDAKHLIANNRVTTAAIEVKGITQENSLEQVDNALKSYSSNESVPEKRFKEGISKVEGQIESILEEQGIETTRENLKAAKALITNGIEVNKENIQLVMDNTIKLDTFIEEMTPYIAAKFIKEGLNPYKASINELLTYIKENNIEGLKQNVAEAIVALEEKGEITNQDKEGLIGLYRIISNVEKNSEEIAGYLYKNNLPVTIQHLEEAVRYIDNPQSKNHISKRIDDSFGENNTKLSEQNAKSKIEATHAEAIKKTEVVELISNMPIAIAEDSKNKLNHINAFLYPFIKEQFKGQMGKFEGMSTLPDSFLEKLEYIKTIDTEVIDTMKSSNIPLTISNIYWFDRINKEPNLYMKLLENQLVKENELPDNIEEIEEELDILEQKAIKEKEIAVNNGDINSYKHNKFLQEMTQVQKQLIKEECIYQIPFVVNGEQRIINLSLDKRNKTRSGKKDELKAIIGYETERLGKIKAYISIKKDEISYKIEGANEQATKALELNKASLDKLIRAIGYSLSEDIEFQTRHHNIEESADKVNRSSNDNESGSINQEGSLVSQIKENQTFFEEVV